MLRMVILCYFVLRVISPVFGQIDVDRLNGPVKSVTQTWYSFKESFGEYSEQQDYVFSYYEINQEKKLITRLYFDEFNYIRSDNIYNGNIVIRSILQSNSLEVVTDFLYDKLGHMVRETQSCNNEILSVAIYKYDENNWNEKSIYSKNGTLIEKTLRIFNEDNLLLSETVYDKSGSKVIYQKEFEYYMNKKLWKEIGTNGFLEYKYNDAGETERYHFLQSKLTAKYIFNRDNNLVYVKHLDVSGTDSNYESFYEYNEEKDLILELHTENKPMWYLYEYIYDNYRNWTEMKTFIKHEKFGRYQTDPQRMYRREIHYHVTNVPDFLNY